MDLAGKTLGNYQVMEEIGRGGMAMVYRAYQPSLNRYVAVKVLPPQLALDRQFVERFLREATAAAGLRHPNIVVVHDVGEQNGLYYIVMEYLRGRTLKQLVQERGALPPARAARIVEQVASALDYAHQQGFVHRDVKPANIFVGDDDHVTLTDFGIAKAVSEAEQLTRTGMLVGTPEYMSPEQAEGGDVDYRTDLYALGVVLFQMLTGEVPFRSTTPHATLHAVIYEPPPRPRQINPALSPAVEAVILKAVAKRPEQRFQRGAALTAALQTAVREMSRRQAAPVRPVPPAARPVPPPAREARRASPLVWILAGLAVALVLVLAGLALLVLGGGSDGAPSAAPSQVIVVVTSTAGVEDAAPTPTETVRPAPSATAESEVSESPEPTPTSPVPTDTAPPVPPTETPTLPPTAVPTVAASPTPPPTVPPTVPACAFPAQGEFAALWQSYRDQLGCPLDAQPRIVQDAEQAFEKGHMFWRADNLYAYVIFQSGSLSGTFQIFKDMWEEGDPVYSCQASPPPGRVQPIRGFGAVWCTLGGASAPIGWGLEDEVGKGAGNGDPLVQDFDRGMIFRDSDGTMNKKAYVFFPDGTFVRVGY